MLRPMEVNAAASETFRRHQAFVESRNSPIRGMFATMPHAPPKSAPDVVVVHSSDLHIDHDYTARLHGGDGTAGLACVLQVARAAAADVVVLAGDTFDCHRLPGDLLGQAAAVISAAAVRVVLLPGNHDPAVPDAVYHCRELALVDNLHVLGVTHEEAIVLDDLGLEIWGRPHRDYGDMIPFENTKAALDVLANRGGAWALCPDSGSNDTIAPVLAHRRRRARSDRRRLCRPRTLEPGGKSRQRRSRLLLRLAGICRNGQPRALACRRRGRGDARQARHRPRTIGRLTAPGAGSIWSRVALLHSTMHLGRS